MVSFTAFVLIHTLTFCILLDDVSNLKRNLTAFDVILPLMLLLIYPLVLIPIVAVLMIRDIQVKSEGFLVWHRDSIGLLLQRFCFCSLMVISMAIFTRCADTTTLGSGTCIGKSLIPLVFPLICVLFKVFCLRSQRMLLWGGFLVCLMAQIIVLYIANVTFSGITTFTAR